MSYMSEDLLCIIGAKIQTLFLSEDKDRIRFETDKGNFDFNCYGDCCSTSWIQHISGIEGSFGKCILKVEDFEIDPTDEMYKEGDYDVLLVYRYAIHFENGHQLDIEFRNDSNGYYGGSLETVKGFSLSELADMKSITKDF